MKHLFFILLLIEKTAYAATRPIEVPSVIGTGGMLKITLSLLLVLGAILAVTWVLKRMNVAQQGKGNMLKVLGSVAVGQRERIVLVEIKETWLLVGVGPGQIRTLHTLPKDDTVSSMPVDDNQFDKVLSMFKSRPSVGKNHAS